MANGQGQVEAPQPVAAKSLRGLESVSRAEIQKHLESGLKTAQRQSRIVAFGDQIEKQVGDAVLAAETKADQTAVHVGTKFKEVHSKRVVLDKEISSARKEKRRLRKSEDKLRKASLEVDEIKTVDVNAPTPELKKGIDKTGDDFKSKIDATVKVVSVQRIEQERKQTESQQKKKDLGYGKALYEEVSKAPEHSRAGKEVKDLSKAVRVLERVSLEVPEYYAGQEALVERIREQAKPEQPIEDAFFDGTKALNKAIKATRKAELKLAREIDRSIKDKKLKAEGRLSETIRGAHVAEDLAIEQEAQRLISEVGEAITPEAVTAAANRVRKLIEQPGFGKKTLDSSLLTRDALQEAIEKKDIIDPIRKPIYRWLSGKQKSVEEILGCEITVQNEGENRLIEIRMSGGQPMSNNGELPLPPDNLPDADLPEWGRRNGLRRSEAREESSSDSNLFASLVQLEHREDVLKRKMADTNPEDLVEIKTVTRALELVAKKRKAVTKLANAKINGVFVADGVRLGALKTKLGDTSLKVGEAAGTAAIAGLITWNGTPQTFLHLFPIPHIEGVAGHVQNARTIVDAFNVAAAPAREALNQANNQIQQLKDLLANGPAQLQALLNGLKGTSGTDVETAIKSSQTAADLLGKVGSTLDKLNQMRALSDQINSAPGQITNLTQTGADAMNQISQMTGEALQGTVSESAAAQRDLLIGSLVTGISAASFSDVVRKAAGAPGRAIRKLFNRE